jgi:preprotein translocase subunit SecA
MDTIEKLLQLNNENDLRLPYRLLKKLFLLSATAKGLDDTYITENFRALAKYQRAIDSVNAIEDAIFKLSADEKAERKAHLTEKYKIVTEAKKVFYSIDERIRRLFGYYKVM